MLNGARCDDFQVKLRAHPTELETVGTGCFGFYGAHEGTILCIVGKLFDDSPQAYERIPHGVILDEDGVILKDVDQDIEEILQDPAKNQRLRQLQKSEIVDQTFDIFIDM